MAVARPAEGNEPWASNGIVEEVQNPNQWKPARKPAKGEQSEAEVMNNLMVTDDNFPHLGR